MLCERDLSCAANEEKLSIRVPGTQLTQASVALPRYIRPRPENSGKTVPIAFGRAVLLLRKLPQEAVHLRGYLLVYNCISWEGPGQTTGSSCQKTYPLALASTTGAKCKGEYIFIRVHTYVTAVQPKTRLALSQIGLHDQFTSLYEETIIARKSILFGVLVCAVRVGWSRYLHTT